MDIEGLFPKHARCGEQPRLHVGGMRGELAVLAVLADQRRLGRSGNTINLINPQTRKQGVAKNRKP